MSPPNSLNKQRRPSLKIRLKLNKQSHKIIKNTPLQIRQSRPQRVINATTSPDFNNVDQRPAGNGQPTASSEVSPAVRLASTERTAFNKKEKPSWSNGDDDMMRMLDNGVQMSQFPGILSPEPAKLPPLPSESFSPITWPATPTDAFSQIFPLGVRTPETLQQKRIGMFSPVLGPQSQTVLSYNDLWPENNAFASPSEFLSFQDDSPPSPPVQFNPFNND
ncbi:protein MKS1-like [Vicia villosa]|uniref:protein MKS1-like n=1 Tax=Vicia villosa TaxID=3911 RepID=UPI00273CAB47|nr:protein MKS1-like [Vicia villosa]